MNRILWALICVCLQGLPQVSWADFCADRYGMMLRVYDQYGICPPENGVARARGLPCDANAPGVPSPDAQRFIDATTYVMRSACTGVQPVELLPRVSPSVQALDVLPIPETGQGFWCKGWRGADIPLRTGPGGTLLTQIEAGEDFSLIDEPLEDHDLWFFYNDHKFGWGAIPAGGFQHCDRTAG